MQSVLLFEVLILQTCEDGLFFFILIACISKSWLCAGDGQKLPLPRHRFPIDKVFMSTEKNKVCALNHMEN